MSDSLQPHGLWPTRLLYPWDSPGKKWNGLPCPSPGDLPDPGIKPMSLMFPALAAGFFTTSATWEAPRKGSLCVKFPLTQTQLLSLWATQIPVFWNLRTRNFMCLWGWLCPESSLRPPPSLMLLWEVEIHQAWSEWEDWRNKSMDRRIPIWFQYYREHNCFFEIDLHLFGGESS